MSNKKQTTLLEGITLSEGWMRQLDDILDKNAGTRVNGKVASDRTQEIVRDTLFSEFKALRNLGYRTMPVNFGNKQMEVLVKNWHYDRKLSNKTMTTHLTQFRKFAQWIGKKGMVRDLAHYLPDVDKKALKVQYAATESKSWSEKGIDIIAEIRKADLIDLRFGAILRMQYAFGYRLKECLKCDPWVTDDVHSMAILPGQGKNNRPRNILIRDEGQRAVIDYVKCIVKKGEKLGWCDVDGTTYSYVKNRRHYYALMEKLGYTKAILGVTGHGLRAEYAEDLALLLGFIPPTLGGTKDQMPKEDASIAHKKVSEALGHSREGITSAYYGGNELMKRNAQKRAQAKQPKPS